MKQEITVSMQAQSVYTWWKGLWGLRVKSLPNPVQSQAIINPFMASVSLPKKKKDDVLGSSKLLKSCKTQVDT